MQFELSSQVYKQLVMARGLVPRGHLGFCHYERSEVIKKTSVAGKQIASVTTFLRNDKVLRQEPRQV